MTPVQAAPSSPESVNAQPVSLNFRTLAPDDRKEPHMPSSRPRPAHQRIFAFRNYLTAERGMAAITVLAYGRTSSTIRTGGRSGLADF